jgi:Spy/CpxP family protein refolding chaperone
MKHIISTILVVLIAGSAALAQNKYGEQHRGTQCPAETVQNQEQQDAPAQEKKKYPTREEIQSQKIAFFTQELDLSPQEAQQFWPVYNEGWKKSHDARKEINRTLKALNEALKSETATDKEIEALMEKYFNALKEEVKIQEETYNAITKVLPVKKAAKTSTLEEKFRVMLIKQLRR